MIKRLAGIALSDKSQNSFELREFFGEQPPQVILFTFDGTHAILYHFSVEGKFSVYVVGDGAFDVPCKNERFEQNHIDEYIIPTNVQF